MAFEAESGSKVEAIIQADLHEFLSNVRPLALGTAGLGGVYRNIENNKANDNNEDIAATTVRAALAGGMNLFDSAPWYLRSESVLGDALAHVNAPRSQYYIATKVGRYPTSDPSNNPNGDFDYSPSRIRASVTASLAKLKTDYLDIVYLHDVEFVHHQPDLMHEALLTLREFQKTRQIRLIGICGYPLEVLDQIVEQSGSLIQIVQSHCHLTLQNNLLVEKASKWFEKGIAVSNAAVLSMGLLTSRGPPDWHPASPGLLKACKKLSTLPSLTSLANLDFLEFSIEDIAIRFSLNTQRKHSNWIAVTVIGCIGSKEVSDTLAARENISPLDATMLQDIQACLGEFHNATWDEVTPASVKKNNDHQEFLEIIDAHIHLYPENEQHMLAWYTPDGPLAGRKSLAEYRSATLPNRPGFIFVETDRRNADGQDWDAPLTELEWTRRIATAGNFKIGDVNTVAIEEGLFVENAPLLRGIVLWAPVSLGPLKLVEYLNRAENAVIDYPEVWQIVRGVRFLLQDKYDGTCCDPLFIESLRLLGQRGLTFDVCIDHHRKGNSQLEGVVEMVQRARENVDAENSVVFILDHLCKPDLTRSHNNPVFESWRSNIVKLSEYSRTFVKLSGCLSEMDDKLKKSSPVEIANAIYPWIDVLLKSFGPGRIMFASDWPVCTIDVDDSWQKWRQVVEEILLKAALSLEDRRLIWGATAKVAY
ncbi:hypothetical protein HK100_003782, partial [Physocladia obscura]